MVKQVITACRKFGLNCFRHQTQRSIHHVDLPASLHHYRRSIKTQYKAIEYVGTRFSVFEADSCIRLPNSSVGKIVNVLHMQDDSTLIVYRRYIQKRSHFKKPMSSEEVGVSRVHQLSTYLLVTTVEQCMKAWLMPMLDFNWSVAVDLL